MSNIDGLFIEIYKATLEFLGKLAVPGAILVLVLSFQDEISNTFEG